MGRPCKTVGSSHFARIRAPKSPSTLRQKAERTSRAGDLNLIASIDSKFQISKNREMKLSFVSASVASLLLATACGCAASRVPLGPYVPQNDGVRFTTVSCP